MPHPGARSLLCVMLSAAMLACGVMPPGIRHAHEGGYDHGHCHDGRSAAVLHEQRDWCADSGQLRRDCLTSPTPVAAVGSGASHLHFRFLGFRWTIPDSTDPVRQTDRGSDGPLVYLRAVGYQDIAPQLNLGADRLLVPLWQVCERGRMTAVRPAVPSPRAIAVNLLCDRARARALRGPVELIPRAHSLRASLT